MRTICNVLSIINPCTPKLSWVSCISWLIPKELKYSAYTGNLYIFIFNLYPLK